MPNTSWECQKCGYLMDADSCPMDDEAVPNNGDITLCLNCGELYVRRTNKWKPLTQKEFVKLPDAVKKEIIRYEAIRQIVVRENLAVKSGK